MTDIERNCRCINGHSFGAVGHGDEPDQAKETYVIRPCPVCGVPTEIEWPLTRTLEVIPQVSARLFLLSALLGGRECEFYENRNIVSRASPLPDSADRKSKIMPTLIAATFNEDQKPIIWRCTGCEEAFTHDKMREATKAEMRTINKSFAYHCRHKHTGQSVGGLVVPK